MCCIALSPAPPNPFPDGREKKPLPTAARVQLGKPATAGATEVARDRLLALGADAKAVARANELEPRALFALHTLDELAASWEEDGPGRSSEYWESPECCDEIVGHLRTVEIARKREQDTAVYTHGDARVPITERVGAGDHQVEAGTGSTKTNGTRPAAIVSELALWMRDRHPKTYTVWWKRWKQEIESARL